MPTSTVPPDIEESYTQLQSRFLKRSGLATINKPYDPDQWDRLAGPPKQEELAEMEDFLRELNNERQASVAREAGVQG
jgi:hypothetical protein